MPEPFYTRIGVPRGCLGSTLLFSLFMSDLRKDLTNANIYLGETLIPYLAYSDDSCGIAESEESLIQQIMSLEKYCLQNKLIINVEKNWKSKDQDS